jgi:hypothetical protein
VTELPNSSESPSPAIEPKPPLKLRERVENHPVVFFLTALLAGFLSGLATYQGALKIIDYTPVANAEYKHLQEIATANSSQASQRWVRLTGLEGLDGKSARIVLRINGRAVSYPSRTVWTQARPNLPIEEFPLPLSTSAYELSFEILTVDQTSGEYREFKSQEVVTVAQFPFRSTYRAFAITSGPAGATNCSPQMGTFACPGSVGSQPVSVAFEVR